jgi:hypothetical protein
MYWATLLCCLLLCLGCARARPLSLGESPEAFLDTMQQRMEAGLEILYFSAQVDQYHAQCLRHYPTLQEPLDVGYHAFQSHHEQLYAAARRYVLLPAAFAPFAESPDRERIDALVDTTDRKFSATRPCGSKGIGGCKVSMKLCVSSSECETRPAKGEPTRAGRKPGDGVSNGLGDA